MHCSFSHIVRSKTSDQDPVQTTKCSLTSLFVRVYDKIIDNFSLPRTQGTLFQKLVTPGFGQGKFVRVYNTRQPARKICSCVQEMERKTWQVYKKVKKYFYGFQVGSHGCIFLHLSQLWGTKGALHRWTWDKCLATCRAGVQTADEQQNFVTEKCRPRVKINLSSKKLVMAPVRELTVEFFLFIYLFIYLTLSVPHWMYTLNI